jgi:uncharacterized Tic20 family protein
MNPRARQQSIFCHLAALLWIPIAVAIGVLLFKWRMTQVMLLGSLSFAADFDHSANFAGMIWLTIIMVISILMILWIPLAIALPKRGTDFFVRQNAIYAFNWLMTLVITVTIATMVITPLDRVTTEGETNPWVPWSLILFIVGSAIAQIFFALLAMGRSHQGKAFRYPFSLPILRS